MTDEEMAEEYADENKINFEYPGISDFVWEELKQAFLAGLKTGRPEWHKVADGDLPKDNEIVLFYTTYFDVWIGGIEPKNDKKHRWEVFPSVSCDYYAEDEVIAWKEIVLPELPKESE